MIGLKHFPRIVTSFYIIGYIFALFAFLQQNKLLFAITTFTVSFALHILDITSLDSRSSRYLIRAKKLIDKGNTQKAAEYILLSAKIQPNEALLVQLNALVKENPGNYETVANLLSNQLNEYDSPFIRFIASSFYYCAKNFLKAKDILIDVPPEKLSVKATRLLGSALYELGDYGKAIKVFTTYDPAQTPANEDDLAIVYGIAICHIAKNENKKAIEFLNRIKFKYPKYGNAENLINQLSEGLHVE